MRRILLLPVGELNLQRALQAQAHASLLRPILQRHQTLHQPEVRGHALHAVLILHLTLNLARGDVAGPLPPPAHVQQRAAHRVVLARQVHHELPPLRAPGEEEPDVRRGVVPGVRDVVHDPALETFTGVGKGERRVRRRLRHSRLLVRVLQNVPHPLQLGVRFLRLLHRDERHVQTNLLAIARAYQVGEELERGFVLGGARAAAGAIGSKVHHRHVLLDQVQNLKPQQLQRLPRAELAVLVEHLEVLRRGGKRVAHAEQLAHLPGQETQHPVDSLGRLARPAHVRPLRAFLILRIGEERLGGGSAVGVSRRAHQRGRHDGGEGSPRVTARAPLQKRREVGGPRPDPAEEPSARRGRSFQQVGEGSPPRV